MKIGGTYSHKDGLEFIKKYRSFALKDIEQAVAACNAVHCLRKVTEEKTKPPLLYSPVAMNATLKSQVHRLGWTEKSINSKKGFKEPRLSFAKGQFREMDGIKDKVGLEIQFGKYAFMGYDIFAKMPMFKAAGRIDCGIELVAMPSVIKVMSTGVSSFAQVILDMKTRGVADLDVPTLVIGIELTPDELKGSEDKAARYDADPTAMIASGEVDAPRKGARPGPKTQARPSIAAIIADPNVEEDDGGEPDEESGDDDES